MPLFHLIWSGRVHLGDKRYSKSSGSSSPLEAKIKTVLIGCVETKGLTGYPFSMDSGAKR
ncbi:hypothetical protein TWF679_002640 [Orbilia oligospora]|uniref:Uncharacterized protein n=1 Tax=Orbilia oligospora TaxID=2813651 RepID=A0A8H8UT06_ORBOL|nr:hypothetical protein TWF679_002640 [Orbilia oligospora]